MAISRSQLLKELLPGLNALFGMQYETYGEEHGTRVAMDVAVGNTVLYAKYAGTEVKLDDKKYLILKETDILAIVE